MFLVGQLIGLAAAVVFFVIGVLTLIGGVVAVRRVLLPGTLSARPTATSLTLVLLGNAIAFFFPALLSILAAIQIARVMLAI